MKLSQEQVDRFAAEGFLVVKGMLDRTGIAALAERAEWIASGTASHIPAERLQREPSVKAGKTPSSLTSIRPRGARAAPTKAKARKPKARKPMVR